MADWMVLKKDDSETPPVWEVLDIKREKTADAAGATQALRETINGPGHYGIVRADNAQTAQVVLDPTITPDAIPQF
jgi:hypothetical protein